MGYWSACMSRSAAEHLDGRLDADDLEQAWTYRLENDGALVGDVIADEIEGELHALVEDACQRLEPAFADQVRKRAWRRSLGAFGARRWRVRPCSLACLSDVLRLSSSASRGGEARPTPCNTPIPIGAPTSRVKEACRSGERNGRPGRSASARTRPHAGAENAKQRRLSLQWEAL